MLLFVFFTFKISFIKKNINKNCPVNLNTNTTNNKTVLKISKNSWEDFRAEYPFQ